MLVIGTVVLSVVGGGLAVTATLSDSSVSSEVNVQIARQFVVPQLGNINQSDIQTSSPGRRSVFRTQNGTTLRVIEENTEANSLTVTVPIENNGTDRGTTRLSTDSSTTPFTIDTKTISESFANNSTFARTVNHTVISDTDALVELPSTVGSEPRAVNVTLTYDTTPASPLTATFKLTSTDSRVNVQPGDSFDGGGGGNSGGDGDGDSGGSGGGSGTSSTDPFSPAASAVVTDGLKIINPNGTDPDDPILVSREDVEAVGTSIDLDGDGRFEQPFVNSSGALKTVEATNTSTGVQIRNETTLVPASSPNSPRSSKTIMTAGRFDGSETSIFYASTNEEIVRVDASGSIKTVTTAQSKAVSEIGDVDGDGVDELAFTDGSANLKYLEPGGSVEKFGTGAGSNNGIGVDGLLDADGDTAQEQLFVGGSNNINAIDANDGGSPTKLTSNGQATKSPLTAADTDRDGQQEVLFVSTSSQELKYVDNVGSGNDIKPVVNASGQPVTGFTETGLASAAAVSSGGSGGSGGSGAEAAVSPVEAQTIVFNEKNQAKLRSVRPNTNQEFGTNIQTKSLGPQTQLFGDSQTEIPFIGNNKRLKAVNQSGNVRTLLNKSENGGVDLREGVRLGAADIDSDGRTAVIFSDNNGRIRRYEPETDELKTVLSTSGVDAHSIGGLADFDSDGSRDELIFTDANKNVRILQTDTGTIETTGFATKNKIKIGSPIVDSGKVKLPAVNANESVVLVNRTGGTRTLTTEGQPTGGLATVDIDDDKTTEILFANGNNNNRINVVELNGDTRELTSTPNKADGNTGVS